MNPDEAAGTEPVSPIDIVEESLSVREKRQRDVAKLREAINAAPEVEKIEDEKKAAIQDNVNAIMPKLGLKPMAKVNVPDEQYGATESLREGGPVNILMVDNEPFTIIDLVIPLSTVSEGHLDVFIQKNESAREVAEIIAAMNPRPDIIVMDYDLSNHVMGDDVVAELRAMGVGSKIVGRSGNEAAIEAFSRHDVPIAFYKPRDCEIDEEMASLAAIYGGEMGVSPYPDEE